MTRLTRTTVSSRLLPGYYGRSIVAARNRHLLVDAPLVLGGPNEEVNPVDLLLASLASHAVFVCQHTARQEGIPLNAIQVSVQADYDPLGVIGEPVYPGFQSLEVWLDVTGPTPEQADLLMNAVQTRCPIYVTLAQGAAVAVEVRVADPA